MQKIILEDRLTSINDILGHIQMHGAYKLNKTDFSGSSFRLSPTDSIQIKSAAENVLVSAELVNLLMQAVTDENTVGSIKSPKSTSIYAPKPIRQEGKIVMSNQYPEEVHYFIERLQIEETMKILYFIDNGSFGIWVVVDEADIDLEMKYSGIFLSVLEKYPGFKCDFMVFEQDEIDSAPVPPYALTVYRRGSV